MDFDYLAKIKSQISIYTRKKTSNILDGEFGSIYRGRSFDFDDLREYVYGDSVRDIDWKSSSKTGISMNSSSVTFCSFSASGPIRSTNFRCVSGYSRLWCSD